MKNSFKKSGYNPMRKNEILSFTRKCMELENILSEVSQAQKNKNCMFSLICGLFFNSFVHMCMHCLGPFSPLLQAPSLSPQPPSLPGRTCSALISNLVEE
jgi:hypothetical protein